MQKAIAKDCYRTFANRTLQTRTSGWLLTFATLLAYANSFSGAFQFDDYRVIVLNPQVQSWADWRAGMPGMRPLLKLSYTLNVSSGFGSVGFHLFNIAVHIINALLVYALCLRLRQPKCGRWFVLFSAAIFALHPVNTEAVTYICGRSSALSATFYLISLLCYDQAYERDNLWLLLSAAGFICAMAIKETAATLPICLLLWDATVRHQDFCLRRSLKCQALHWAVLLLGAGIFLVSPTYRWLFDVSAGLRPFHDNLLTHLNALAWLTGQWWLPIKLNADPMLPSLTEWTWFSALQACVIVIAIAWSLMALKRRPIPAFGILWCLLQLLPLHLLMPRLDPANERQLYLAGIGFAIVAAYGLRHYLASKYRIRIVGVTLVLLVALATATMARNRVYHDEIGFWQDVAQKSPHNARAFNNLGFAYKEAGRYLEAKAAYRRALELNPNYSRARFNLLLLAKATGKAVISETAVSD